MTGRSSQARGAYAPGRARQTDILRAAATVFSTAGFRGGSLRDIAALAGITSGAVLHHFGSKERLLFAVLDERDRTIADPYAVRQASGDFIGSLRQIVADNLLDRGGVQLYATIAAEATAPAHPAHDYFVQRYRSLEARIRSNLAPILDLPQHHPRVVTGASNILAVMDGLQTQWLFDDQFDMQGAFDSYLLDVGLLDVAV